MAAASLAALPPDRARGYGDRNRMLDALGFSSYADYLSSDLWKAVRASVLTEGVKCSCCRRQASQVHHHFYTPANLAGETTVGLYPICAGCHGSVELGKKGGKRTLAKAEERFARQASGRRRRQRRKKDKARPPKQERRRLRDERRRELGWLPCIGGRCDRLAKPGETHCRVCMAAIGVIRKAAMADRRETAREAPKAARLRGKPARSPGPIFTQGEPTELERWLQRHRAGSDRALCRR